MKTKNRNWFFLFLIMGLILILVYGCPGSDEDNNTTSITDKDGNIYTSITIGTQVWMVENLKTTKLNDGTEIPNVTDYFTWENLTSPGYCWYDNEVANKVIYGALYNWYTVQTGKLCPTGWHVPSNAEWGTLIEYLGGDLAAGGKMKEIGTTHWRNPNEATNESGFTALPGGLRACCGYNFWQIGLMTYWWTSTKFDDNPPKAWVYFVLYQAGSITSDALHGYDGASIRCLKDY